MDELLRGVCFDGKIAFAVLKTTQTVNRAIQIHALSPTAAAAVGRTLTGTAFMATSLKNERDALTVTVAGGGPIGRIIACANSSLEVRVTVDNPAVDLPPNALGKLDVRGAVGTQGKITVVKSLGLKEPYVGSCNIVSGEIAQDFAAYYTYSEQQPTAIALGVLVNKDGTCHGAGGVVFQPMPDAEDEHIKKVEELLPRLSKVSSMFENMSAKEVLFDLLGEISYEAYPVSYVCPCSREHFIRGVATLGKQEVETMLIEDGEIRVTCDFCRQEYVYGREDFQTLLKD
ncbi:MAG: Hsp33 family molecular chaperone HslO [Clostridiales bacterium]|nr:Hsp33 family molecular chaperone HslO [Clostridiales bacterium]